MSDRTDSSDFQDRDHFLRRTFVWQIEEPENLAALLKLGEILQEWICELNQFGPRKDCNFKTEQFRAAGEDLLLIGAYLRSKADERFDCGFSESTARRCERADHWAEQAEALGRLILEDVAQDDAGDGDEDDQ
jgi:hypothetical protein